MDEPGDLPSAKTFERCAEGNALVEAILSAFANLARPAAPRTARATKVPTQMMVFFMTASPSCGRR